MPTVDDEDEDLFEPIDTFVYIDYQRFNSVLNAYGLSIEEGTTLEGMMRLQDDPHEDDVIEIYYPYDEKENDSMYSFIHQITMNKYKYIQDESNFGKDNFIPSKMREFTESCRIENARLTKLIDDSEDGIEIKIDDRVLIKNILISDANLIKDLVRKEY